MLGRLKELFLKELFFQRRFIIVNDYGRMFLANATENITLLRTLAGPVAARATTDAYRATTDAYMYM